MLTVEVPVVLSFSYSGDGSAALVRTASGDIRKLARGDHLEASGARPVDHLADQRRLIAVRQAVDDASGLGALGEQRADERVGLDVDHHQVLAVLDGGERVANAGRRAARRLDQHVELRRSHEGVGVVSDARRIAGGGCGERRRGELFGWPADAGECLTRTLRVVVGNADNVQRTESAHYATSAKQRLSSQACSCRSPSI